MPGYLYDLQQATVEGRMSERKFIEFLERLLAVVTTDTATKVLRQLQLGPRVLFSGIGHEKLPKVQAFIEKRLPRQG